MYSVAGIAQQDRCLLYTIQDKNHKYEKAGMTFLHFLNQVLQRFYKSLFEKYISKDEKLHKEF